MLCVRWTFRSRQRRPQMYRPRADAVQARAPTATIGRAGALVAGLLQESAGPGPSDYVIHNPRQARASGDE